MQDSNIGKTFPVAGSTFTCINLVRRTASHKWYEFSCSKCSLDEELWPSGSIVSRIDSLSVGVPCGCKVPTRWKEWQYRVIVKRQADKKGFEFAGWASPFSFQTTRVNAVCRHHGSFCGASINQFLRDTGCPRCSAEKHSERMLDRPKKPDQEIIDTFYKNCTRPEGTIFRKHERKNHWYIYCPVCANDEYTRAGLCTGEFFAFCGTFKNGGTPCRCSERCIYTKEQRAYQINKEFEGKGVKFVSWHEHTKFTTRVKAVLECEIHGYFSSVFRAICVNKSGCPGCAKTGFDQTENGSVYVLISDCGGYTKVGISKNVESRIAQLQSKTPFRISKLASFEMIGKDALSIEGECHRLFMSAGFKGFDGATEWLRSDPDIIEYIKKRA